VTDDAPAPPAKSRSNAGKFAKGHSANPSGKKRGTKNRRTILAAKLLASIDIPGILAKMEKQAKAGDHAAAKLLLDRALPVRRGCPIAIKLAPIRTTADVVNALAAVAAAMAAGKLSPEEAASVAGIIELQRKAIETQEIETRLHALEAKFK
jgi:hypothetical protein